MAEGDPKIPGTDIEVITKYDPGKRADFPTFSSVCKSSFAKGVITDFKKTSDDPITVESMVKVDIGGDAWLPLFYHPKAQYWDAPPVLATDFDSATGAFKQAWMSFRCGDEVAVMLKEGTPVAVMGFADGVPRIGEDIFKFAWNMIDGTPYFMHFQCSKEGLLYGDVNEDVKGPDDKELNLLLEATKICQTGISSRFIPPPEGWHPSGGLQYYYQYMEWLVPIGPIVYLLQVLAWDYWMIGSPTDISYHTSISVQGAIITNNLIDDMISLGEANNSKLAYPDIYNLGLLDPFIGYLQYPGFNYQLTFDYNILHAGDPLPSIYVPGLGPGILFPAYSSDIHINPNPLTFKIYVRPHTKAELQACGFWPAPL